jgi:hypothetical protein
LIRPRRARGKNAAHRLINAASWEKSTAHRLINAASWEKSTAHRLINAASWEKSTAHRSVDISSWEDSTAHRFVDVASWEDSTAHWFIDATRVGKRAAARLFQHPSATKPATQTLAEYLLPHLNDRAGILPLPGTPFE